MRCFKLLFMGAAVLALTVPALAVTAVPNASKLYYCERIRLDAGFDGFEIDYGTVQPRDDDGNAVGGPVNLGQAANVSYIPGAYDPRPGAQQPATPGLFVLYDAQGNVVADVGSDGKASAPGFPNLGVMLGTHQFSTFGVGSFSAIEEPPGTEVGKPQQYPGQDWGAMTTHQLTFTVDDLLLTIDSPQAANFEVSGVDLDGDGVDDVMTGTLKTVFANDSGRFEVIEDSSADIDTRPANISAPGVPAGELPTAFFDRVNQDYYDNTATADPVFSYDKTAAGTDAGENLVMILKHDQGLEGDDIFNEDLRAGFLTHPSWPNWNDGSLIGGKTAFTTSPDDGISLIGGSWYGTVLDPDVGFALTSDVAFGRIGTKGTAVEVGVNPEDPDTFTFQTPLGGGPLLTGGHVIPEPVTMAGLMLGVGSLVGYVRRRRK